VKTLVLVRRSFKLTRTEDARSMAIQQRAQQNSGTNRFTPDWRTVRVDSAQVQQRDDVNNKTHQMLRRQAVFHSDRLLDLRHPRRSVSAAGDGGQSVTLSCDTRADNFQVLD